MNYPKTFSIVFGFHKLPLTKDFQERFGIKEKVVYNVNYFSIDIYNESEPLSADNRPIEIYAFSNNFKDDSFLDFKTIGNLLFNDISMLDFIKNLEKFGFKHETVYNIVKKTANTYSFDGHSLKYYVIKNLKDTVAVDEIIEKIKKVWLDLHVEYWTNLYETSPDFDISHVPDEVLKIIKPKISKMNDIGIFEKIQTFQQFNDSRVWELKRKAVKPHNMPNIGRQSDYLQTVKEEIENILKNLYNFSQEKIDEIQSAIWLKLKNEWQDILDDSLVNWDTPSICAQKCLTRMKEFMPFMEKNSNETI